MEQRVGISLEQNMFPRMDALLAVCLARAKDMLLNKWTTGKALAQTRPSNPRRNERSRRLFRALPGYSCKKDRFFLK